MGLLGPVVPAAVADEGHGETGGVLVEAEGSAVALLVYISFVVLRGGVHQVHLGLGGVVLVFHPRGGSPLALLQLVEDRRVHLHPAQHLPELGHGDAPGPQHLGHALRQGDDRGLHPHGAVAAVHQGVHPAGEVLLHMGEGGGAGPAGEVGRGGRQGHPGLPDDRLGHRVGGEPHRHRVQASAGLGGHQVRLFQDDGEGPGPEGLGQLFGGFRHLPHQGGQLAKVADMDDEGVIRGAAFRLIDGLHRRPVQGVGGQAVHRLGGDGHQAPRPQELPGLFQVLGPVPFQQNRVFHRQASYPANRRSFTLGPPAWRPGPRR